MGNAFYFEWEPKLMEWLQAHLGSFGTAFMSAISDFGGEMILLAVVCTFYFALNKDDAKYAARRFLVSGCFFSGIKNIVCRLRPYFVHENIKCLKPVESKAELYDVAAQGYSFPSGHASGSFTIFGGIAVRQKKHWVTIVCTLVILLVGLSRFCVGVHYPTDVLAGWAVGLASMLLFSLLEKLIKDIRIIYLIWVVVFAAGFFFCTTNDFYTNYGMMIGAFAADIFESSRVRFERPSNPFRAVIRILVAFALYFGLNTLLKLPFSSEFLASGTLAAHLVRTVRYAIVVFVMMGVYPICFRFFNNREAAA